MPVYVCARLLEMKIDVFLVSFLHPESYFIVVEIHFKS